MINYVDFNWYYKIPLLIVFSVVVKLDKIK